jgi:subtilase family serine protease
VSRRLHSLMLGGLLVAAAVLFALYGSRPANRARRGGAPKAAMTRVARGAQVDFSLVLRLPGQSRLQHFLSALAEPGSPSFHHYLAASAFGRRFGLSGRELARVRRWLRAHRVRVIADYPQRTALDVRASAATVDRLFGADLRERVSPAGARLHQPGRTPVVPAALRFAVTAVAGLDAQAVPHPDDVPQGGLRPGDAARAYDIAPLRNQGISGQGERLGIISFGTYQPSDIAQFDQQFNLPALSVENSPAPAPVGGATDSSSDAQAEMALDLEVSHEVAPGATIIDYNAPVTDASGADTLGAVVDEIVAAGQTSVVSDSWGFCELTLPTSDIQRDEQALEAAAAHGITIFKSSGDAGAYQCQRATASDTRRTVEWPASSPYVVSVGGTSLGVTSSGGYSSEAAWEDPLSRGGGGGGLSAYYGHPAWQRGPGVENRYSNGRRQVPDVSADADPATGWATVSGGQLGESGGTSAASPFWAAAMVLVEQYVRTHGGGRLGFAAPMLYAVAAHPRPAAAFHDVTSGSNRYYPAGPGWDFATGLGSPDVYNLARDAASYQRSH